jgi:glucose/arabinose dehydrogenase
VTGTTVVTRLVENIGGPAVLVTAPTGDPRLYVVDKTGRIRIIDESEVLLSEPFIDLSDDNGGPVESNGELGLLGLAFHPQYQTNRQFYVFYTKRQVPADATYPFRDTVARCLRDETDPDKAAPACVEILSIPDYGANHNGGMIEFGSDGFLYISTGDGGLQQDPDGNGQTLIDGQPTARSIALLGKMLRIDVDDPNGTYGIPADNPFASGGGAPEIFMRGFRNPWRWSFDRANGDFWIGDVGQSTIEEIHFVTAAEANGKNFGWDTWDGTTCFANRTPAATPCEMTGFEFPQDERTHAGDGFESIIGGQVYRGSCYPDLVGTYFYTDNDRGGLSTARIDGGTFTKQDLTGTFPTSPASIHAAANGELYLTTTSGGVFHIEVPR